jgi:hypothetical protein
LNVLNFKEIDLQRKERVRKLLQHKVRRNINKKEDKVFPKKEGRNDFSI